MIFSNNKFTVSEMIEMENMLRNSRLHSLELNADDDELSNKLMLKVEYVSDMHDDNEAELLPIDNPNYYGLIRLNSDLKKTKFAYIHEIIHYIFDVGYGNRVCTSFSRKRRGKTINKDEQRINYMTAAYIMPYEQISKALMEYDSSSPKMDELKFISKLKNQYGQSETAVIRRIREVRKIEKYGQLK